MIQVVSFVFMFVFWLQAPAAEVVSNDKIAVSPVSVSETRHRSLIEEKDVFGNRSGTEIVVRVQGAAVEDASSYGQVKLTEAVDDAGGDLKPQKRGPSMGSEGFEPIRSGMGGMMQKKGEKGFRMKIALGPAARKATKIRSVKGEFEVLAGGKEEVVTVKGVSALIGKSVDDPQLKKAGVELQVVDPKKAESGFLGTGGPNSLSIKLTGTVSAVQTIEVLDKSGGSLSQGQMSSGSERSKSTTFDLKRPLDDSVTLKIKLVVGQKAVKVPLELKDVPLP